MEFKLFYQSFYLTFLVWLGIILLINCTPVNDGVHKVSASKERKKHLEIAESSILAGQIAKNGKVDAQYYGRNHFQDAFSVLSKNAGYIAGFHFSKADKTTGKKVRIDDGTIYRHLSKSSKAAGRIAKENKKQAQKEGNKYYEEAFSNLSKLSGRMAAFHISKKKSAAPTQANS